MSRLLSFLFGRLPIGWLQLSHSKGRLFAAIAEVAFANLLVFLQLGVMGALNNSTVAPYGLIGGDILLSFGIEAAQPGFVAPVIAPDMTRLVIENTALLDPDTRGLPKDALPRITSGQPYAFEASGQTLTAIGTMAVGGGFLADGMMVTSDQTFLRVFKSRTSGAPFCPLQS